MVLDKYPKYTLGLSIVLLFCLSSVNAQAVNTDSLRLKLSLDDALKYAFNHSEQLKIKALEQHTSRYERKMTIAKLYPRLDIDADYSYTLKKQVMYFGGGEEGMAIPAIPGMPDMSAGIEVGRRNNINAGITLSMPLISPQLWTSIKISSSNLKAALIEAEIFKVELSYQVTTAFYTHLLAFETFKVISQSLDNARLALEDISRKYEAGLVALYDKMRAEVQLKNLEPQVLEAQNSLQNTERLLSILIGLSPEQGIETVSNAFSLRSSSSLVDSLNAYLFRPKISRANFIELKKLNASLATLKLQERLSKDAFLPSLNIVGFYRVNAMDDRFKIEDYKWTPFSIIQLSLKIPLFAGGERRAQLYKSKLKTEQLKLQKQILEKDLSSKEDNLKNSFNVLRGKLLASDKAVELASKAYEIAKKRYATGASTLLELNDADLALLQAKLNQKQAIYEYYKLKAEYDKLQAYTYN